MKLEIKNKPLKISHSYEYTFDNKYSKITLSKNTLLFPIFDVRKNKQIGYLLDGPTGLTADLLVHSDEGAVGEILEESYSKLMIFPVQLPFLSLDHVKEVKPVEDMEPYNNIVRDVRFRFVSHTSDVQTKNNVILIHTLKKDLMWFIGPNSTYLISSSEIIGRRGEGQLFWLLKGEIILVNKNGKIKRLSDVFSINKARKHFDRYIGEPLRQAFSGFREIFAEF